jgi:hypothetical protein
MRSFTLSCSLLALACGPTDAMTDDTGASDTTDAAPTTGEPTGTDTDGAGSVCPVPEFDSPAEFSVDLGGFPGGADVVTPCTLNGGGAGDDFDQSFELLCIDEQGVGHTVTIRMQLFFEVNIDFTEDMLTLHYHREEGLGVDREVVALRGFEDSLVMFGARGYDALQPELAGLWAPLAFAAVDPPCPATGECVLERRAALDVTLGATTRRLFGDERAEFEVPPFELTVQVGDAHLVENSVECPGDNPTGLRASLVVLRQFP